MRIQFPLNPSQIMRLNIFTSVLVILLLSFFKYNPGEINYRNSDATWHTLLTIQAYEETPISVHKFLPIVTLGKPEDKGIPWGCYLSDDAGNYYYTSFSAIGFFAPWAFMKIFHLPINELSLYKFNTILQIFSIIIWLLLIGTFYRDNKYRNLLLPLAALPVIFAPETMHNMGIGYWHHSLMQVTLPLQMLMYLLWRRDNTRWAKYAFLTITLINPIIEWTGYVANVGFAILEFIKTKNVNLSERSAIGTRGSVIGILILTAGSFVLFSLHYLLVVSFHDYFSILYARFISRSFNGSSAQLGVYSYNIFHGYINSFWAWWFVTSFLFVFALIQNGKIEMTELKHKLALFILAFIGLENIIMSQHASIYSFDRMKMVFLLSFITCDLFNQILKKASSVNKICIMVFSCAITCCGVNFWHYLSSRDYVWTINYRTQNQRFADYINKNYPNSILGSNVAIPRGYTTLLFHRNIVEPPTELFDVAQERHAHYAILLHFKDEHGVSFYGVTLSPTAVHSNMLELKQAYVYDFETKTAHNISTNTISHVPINPIREQSE